MAWMVEYLPEALEDLRKLDGSVRARVLKAIAKVAQNPLPEYEGGYGKPLGNKRTYDLTGLLKVKLKKDGIRIVYKVELTDTGMKVIVIGNRADEEVYRLAGIRRTKHGL